MTTRRLARNRSEVFYTATVLPMLVAGYGTDGFRRLAVRAGAAEDAAAEDAPLEIITEYDHVKAITSAASDDWPTRPAVAATPDLVLWLDGDLPTLVAVEAKMFHRPAPGPIASQLSNQRQVLDAIAKDLGGEIDIIQALLVPSAFAVTLPSFDAVAVLTWETILDLYPDAESYWRDVLAEALGEYATLRSGTVKIFDDKVTGAELVDSDHDWGWVGIRGGTNGLEAAVEQGHWRDRSFEVREGPPPTNNPNWMPIETFQEIVDQEVPDEDINPIPPLTATIAMSWEIALAIFDGTYVPGPAVRLHRPIPGAEAMYDLLTIEAPDRPGRGVDINRPGSIHLRDSGAVTRVPWREYVADPFAVQTRILEWLGSNKPPHQQTSGGQQRRRFMLEVLGMIDVWTAYHVGGELEVDTINDHDVFGYHYAIGPPDSRLEMSEYGGVRLPDGTITSLWREAGAEAHVGAALLLGHLGELLAVPEADPPALRYERRHDIDSTPCLVALPDADTPERWHVTLEVDGRTVQVDAKPFVVEFPKQLRGRPSWPDDATIEGP